ncbi:flavin reductase [Xanthobacter agilis]|jgi:flavin reductase|uniref:Flavin reductase n=1 Tax=Xanthobacter agilis TaxID=47492 RepID=A0ABU0LJL0_XANAG|nr:flavin reductase [Xanthobacter agilis]MDQ0507318.1 flavin reductase [Xanthobacter agilis]
MVEVQDYRDGMALLGSAVSVITTDGPAGRAGFTATAVSSVTDQPPTLLVCQNKSSYAHRLFLENKVLCVNVLSQNHESLSAAFADRALEVEARFARAQWSQLATRSPVLSHALVAFDCAIVDSHEVGSHVVFFAQVHGIQLGGGSGGLVYFDRAYHALAHRAPAPA